MSGKSKTITYVQSTGSCICIVAVGAVFLLMGVAVNRAEPAENAAANQISPAYGLLMAVIGLWIISIGVIPLFFEPGKKKHMIADLMRMNNTVMATIVGFPSNPGNKINVKAPYVLECRYENEITGLTHVYYGNAFRMPDSRLIGCRVRVYIDKGDPASYFVDMTYIENPAALYTPGMGGGMR